MPTGAAQSRAVVATLIAFVYAQYLFAAVRMANLLGFPLRDTLFRMDLPYAWRIVRDSRHGVGYRIRADRLRRRRDGDDAANKR